MISCSEASVDTASVPAVLAVYGVPSTSPRLKPTVPLQALDLMRLPANPGNPSVEATRRSSSPNRPTEHGQLPLVLCNCLRSVPHLRPRPGQQAGERVPPLLPSHSAHRQHHRHRRNCQFFVQMFQIAVTRHSCSVPRECLPLSDVDLMDRGLAHSR